MSERKENETPGALRDKGRILRRILDKVLFVAILAFILLLLFFSISVIGTQASGGRQSYIGMQFRVVATGSMEGEETFYHEHDFQIGALPVGTMAFIRELPRDGAKRAAAYAELKEGDVLTFVYDWPDMGRILLTHRIIEIERDAEETVIFLQGDSPYCEGEIQRISSKEDAVIGQVIGQSRLLGGAVVFLQRGWAYLLLFGLVIVLLTRELKRIVYGADFGDESFSPLL